MPPPSLSFVIAPAVPSDIEFLLPLLHALFTIEQDFVPHTETQRRGLLMLLGDPSRAVVLTARLTPLGKILGMVSGQLVISTAQGGLSVWVEDLIVAPAMRHHGLGQTLLDAVLHWAREHGATRAQLLADARNTPALSFYDHLGWETTAMGARRLLLEPKGKNT